MILELILLGNLTVTSYQPIKAQTDDSPTWTSIGDRTTKFGCAVSQDLLKDGLVSYGDVLYVPGYGWKIVNDTMNARHKKHVDLLVFTHAEEKAVGVRHLKIYKVSQPMEDTHALQALSKIIGHPKSKVTQGRTQPSIHRK